MHPGQLRSTSKNKPMRIVTPSALNRIVNKGFYYRCSLFFEPNIISEQTRTRASILRFSEIKSARKLIIFYKIGTLPAFGDRS